MGSISTPNTEEFDVVIVGAGLSGINAAYRVQTQLPGYTYTIIEARNAIGGTWDLFRYPGIRSDSDLHTFGFPWRPWLAAKAIADGDSIRNYIRESAEEFGIDKKIQYNTKLVAADWGSDEQKWFLSTESKNKGSSGKLKARFVVFSTGYYDYDEPLKANIPNLEAFKGQTIHPQFWPEDLDYTGKKMVIIGSGATAITIFPVAAKKAASQNLPKNIPLDPHFKPRYNPWEQRLCVCPDGDFYTALKNGNTDIVTGNIKSVTETGLIMDSGKEIDADIIITATGLKIMLAGGTKISIDGKHVNPNEKFLWKNTMIQDVPNAAVIIGYTNASWTLGSDTAALLICRILKRMESMNLTSATPSLGRTSSPSSNGYITGSEEKLKVNGNIEARDPQWDGMKEMKLLDLNSTYVEKAKGILPKTGDRGPWQPRSSYFADAWGSVFGNITRGVRYEGGGGKKVV
ncbi:putative FAD-containing monooxygenase EthA [Glarea lozoyensis 74030]|uniref:Putative FAD-containing monooxygenase EthA n=1 Tax=Glarea lozoyensis (strain ATCC 74030 / MF5533) TaxID=1104152 RepID=H0EIM5_GLAL7|nr:putative FAD-containing monooxygenase EthA [Glarea lozoyensis 74030]